MTCARGALGLAVVMVAAAGCGGSGGQGSIVHDVKFDVGGAVHYLLDVDRPLSGVTITLTDVDGKTEVATSSSNGLWTATNLHPGPWVERFELAGYEPVERAFVLAVGGENDISNVFEARPDAFLEETLLRATIAPFGVTIYGGQSFRDGFGYTLEYSLASDGPIVITFSRPVYDADADLRDGETGQNQGANFDAVTDTVTITEADINSINGGANPLTVDSDPWTFHRIQIYAAAITPLNGDDEGLFANLYINAVP